MDLVYPPAFCIAPFSNITWVSQSSPRVIKDNGYVTFWGLHKVRYELSKIAELNALSIYLSIHPSIRPSVRPSVRPSIHPSIYYYYYYYYYYYNHNYNKIVESDWLSTALISALIGQYAPSRARLNGFFFSLLAKQNFEFLVF